MSTVLPLTTSMVRSPEILHQVDSGQALSPRRKLEGIRVCVASPAALYRLKRSTVRPLDRRDAEALRQHFGLEEED